MKFIKNLEFDELKSFLLDRNQKEFRANQIFEWLYKKNSLNINEWSNIPMELRDIIEREFILNSMRMINKEIGDGSIKYLFDLIDHSIIESVFLKYEFGNSICISTQVGCNMNCAFCASTIGGKSRNLEPAEMIDQIINIENDTGEKISNIVLMGSGEPFDNSENVYKFIEIINTQYGKNIGARHITISTVGIIPEIYKFSEYEKQVNLAVSLHAPINQLRNMLIPINKKYPIEELMKAIDYYIRKTNRRVTIEYALIDGVNDSIEMAEKLCQLLKGKLVHVNLIPINQVEGKNYKRPSKEKITEFYTILKKRNIPVSIRRELGSNISAACGQLRAKHSKKVDNAN